MAKLPSVAIPAGSDFRVPVEPKQQANAVLFSDAGCGKTTAVAMYAPDPVAFINYDQRDGFALMEAMRAGRRVMRMHIDYPANITKLTDQEARKIGHAAVDKTVKNVEIAVRESQKGNISSICLDTGTELGEIAKLAFAGRIDKVDDFGKSKDLVNRTIWRLFHTAREGNAHLFVLGRAQPEPWVNGNPTGKFKFRGNETFIDACDWAGNIRIVKPKNPKAKREMKFELEITKAGVNGDQMGEVYTEEDWGEYGMLVWALTMNYPNSSPEDWS
jgi:hypothetical protein